MAASNYRLDANVIIRFLTGKPEDMAKKARSLMERADHGEMTLYVSELVLAEVYWVLYSYYDFSRSKIKSVLVQFINARGIESDSASLIERALTISDEKNLDFIDAVLSLKAQEADQEVVTFDREDFEKLPAKWFVPGED